MGGLLIGGLLVGLAGCAYMQGEAIPTLPTAAWDVLPLDDFLTRDTMHVEAMEFCRIASCGFDAAVARFAATAGEARTLRATLADPVRLRALIEARSASDKRAPAIVEVDRFAIPGWRGLKAIIVDAKTGKSAFGVALGRPDAGGTDFILSIAGKPDIAEQMAIAAAR